MQGEDGKQSLETGEVACVVVLNLAEKSVGVRGATELVMSDTERNDSVFL